MSNGSPPPRRRPTTGSSSGASAGGASSGGATGQRPAVRRTATGAIPAARPEPAPAPPLPVTGTKLVVSGGPRAGDEFALEDGEYVVGRAADNPICIPDTSVSRKH